VKAKHSTSDPDSNIIYGSNTNYYYHHHHYRRRQTKDENNRRIKTKQVHTVLDYYV
jgi:hypothetical protein